MAHKVCKFGDHLLETRTESRCTPRQIGPEKSGNVCEKAKEQFPSLCSFFHPEQSGEHLMFENYWQMCP